MPKLTGEISILGKTIEDYSDKELARTVGVVLTERPNAGDLTVAELIGLGRSPYTGFWGRLNSNDETVVKKVISWIKIEELANRQVLKLSDGEWQKMMIAKTLAQETPVIYLDEPTAFLDFPSKVEIMRLLLDLTRNAGKTIFLSTHDLELAMQIADTLWLMGGENGITVGTPDELRLNRSIENFFHCEGVVFDRETGFFRIKPLPPPPSPSEGGGETPLPFGEGLGVGLHYFNPGHEAAVLNASKHYNPPAQVVKMQSDLAFLPAWYASEGDFVFVEKPLPDDFILSCKSLNLSVKPVIFDDLVVSQEAFQHLTVDLWGISPQSIHFFEKLREKANFPLTVPQWKEAFGFLGSRFASREILAALLARVSETESEILPQFVSSIEAIEQQIAHSQESLLIKSPYSSSGRGLLRLFPGQLPQSERQIITGILKKQKQVSIEKFLDKRLDFSMHFEITALGKTQFIGYSVFQTNAKGAYEKSLLGGQDYLEKQITNYIHPDLLMQNRTVLTKKIQEMYAPYYSGTIGIDMLIYQSGDSCRLHPCVEINMRKSMGYLAIRLAEKYLHPHSQGELFIDYHSDTQTTGLNHKILQKQHPLVIESGRIRSGYFNLCPISEATGYHAYIVLQDRL